MRKLAVHFSIAALLALGFARQLAAATRTAGGSKPGSSARVALVSLLVLTLLAGAGCRHAPAVVRDASKDSPSDAGRKRTEPWRENRSLVVVRGVVWNEKITADKPLEISLVVKNVSKGDVYALKRFNSNNYSLVRKNSSSYVHGDAEGPSSDRDFVRLKPGETMVFSHSFLHDEEAGEGELHVMFHNNMPGEHQAAPQRDGIPIVNDLEYNFGKIVVQPSAKSVAQSGEKTFRSKQNRPSSANDSNLTITSGA